MDGANVLAIAPSVVVTYADSQHALRRSLHGRRMDRQAAAAVRQLRAVEPARAIDAARSVFGDWRGYCVRAVHNVMLERDDSLGFDKDTVYFKEVSVARLGE